MTIFSKMTFAGAIAALTMGAAVIAVPAPAAAFVSTGHHYHHRWHVRPYGVPYVYGYGEAPRYRTGYYFTTSAFCIPDRNNGYNGGFSTLAYGAKGRVLGYVCE